MRSLIISSQRSTLDRLKKFLEGRGHQVSTREPLDPNENFLEQDVFDHQVSCDLIILDCEYAIQKASALCTELKYFSDQYPPMILALIHDHQIHQASDLIRAGADDVCILPIENAKLHVRFASLENRAGLRQQRIVGHQKSLKSKNHILSAMQGFPGTLFRLVIGPDGKIEVPFVDHQINTLLGLDAAEVRKNPQTFVNVFPEELRRQILNADHALHLKNQRFQFYSDVTNRWVELIVDNSHSDGEKRICNGFLTDFTEKKESEERLHESEKSFRTLIESAPDAIFVHRNEECIYANPSAIKQFGYSDESEMKGESLSRLIHESNQDLARMRKEQFIDRGKKAPAVEMKFVQKNGEIFTAEVVSIPVMYAGDSSILVMMRDLSERKELQSKLMFADRMASVGTLAAGVAHELNNPLAYVLSNLKLMKEEIDLSTNETIKNRMRPILELIEESIHGAERMGNIVRDLKTFSRVDDERMTSVSLEEILDSSLNMCANEIKHKARLTKDMGFTPPVKINEGRLGQVFLNLLVNAVQALPEDLASENKIEIRTCTDERGWAKVEIEDSGNGISSETMKRMYEPFFTTKGKVEGTGLGLSICRNIIERAGGEIHCESQIGHGTTFTISLPPCAEEKAFSSRSPSLISEVPPRMKVLIIDDEERVARSLKRTLRHHDVKVFNSGRKAADFLIGGGSFDIILCDVMMPEVSGIDLYHKVKEHRPDIANRFVFMTGGAFTSQAREFLENLPYEYIEKPFDITQVRRIVRERAGMIYEPAESGSFQKAPVPRWFKEEMLNGSSK